MNKHQGIKNIATNYQLRKYLAKTTLEERAENDRMLRLMLAQNNIRIPIYINGKDCSNEMGVDLLNNGDDILVNNGKYKVTVYDDDKLRYIPVI